MIHPDRSGAQLAAAAIPWSLADYLTHLQVLEPGPARDALTRRFDGIVNAITSDARPLACNHTAGIDAVICTQHAAAGVHCTRCFVDHVDHHQLVRPRICDACDRHAVTLLSVVHFPTLTARLYRPDGRTLEYHGEPMIGTFGLCPRCAGDAGRAHLRTL